MFLWPTLQISRGRQEGWLRFQGAPESVCMACHSEVRPPGHSALQPPAGWSISKVPLHSRGLPKAAGEHTGFLLCLAIRMALLSKSMKSLKEGTLSVGPQLPNPPTPNMEKQSEYAKSEKHTQSGCSKSTAVNIKYFVWEKDGRKHRVNKIAADGWVRG